jgi:hypothetical protein
MSSSERAPSGKSHHAHGQVVTLASTLAAAMRRIAAVSGGAGLLVWSVLFDGGTSGSLSGAITGLVAFLFPAAILGLLYLGLRDLLALPDRLSSRRDNATEWLPKITGPVADEQDLSAAERLWQIVKQVWTLRSVLSQYRGAILRCTLALRVLNPGFLLLALGAIAATGLMVLGAGIAILILIASLL